MSNKKEVVESIKKYVRAANYISVAQIYLQNNFLLSSNLKSIDIKPKLLGHWGTCPGINFIYSNLNYLIKKHNSEMLFILGPGHGFPALQANLFLEGTLSEYYSATQDEIGLSYLCKNFSWPYGFPSHSNPAAPGVILEGGELGYSLSTAYGAILDNPELIAACVIGDGEAETGALATAWHLNKFIDPKTNGAVLPILHVNGYKISGPTIFGRMSNNDLKALFSGYGYEPIIVEGNNLYEKMIDSLELSYNKIKLIQNKARSGKKQKEIRFPMLILKTPKGWTGIKQLYGEKIEGNCLSHQVVAKDARTDPKELKEIEKWLKSYNFEQLFHKEKGFCEEIKNLIPKKELRMGNNKHSLAKDYKPLILPNVNEFIEEAKVPGIIGSSSMRRAGLYLSKVMSLNKTNFRFFSPDETYSNKLDAIFKSTKRAFILPIYPWDKDFSSDGKVIEILSEHSLQGLAQGYILTGRHAVFASYEAFIEIVSSMADQYAKFLKTARTISWRKDIASFNYILTSSGWRQEHNGFSHQNPKFISGMLEKNGEFTKVYFPPDGNSTLVVLKQCLESKNGINIIVAGKTQEPRWLNLEKAQEELIKGMLVWDFASDPDPDLVFVGIGDYMTKECLAAINLLKTELPKLKLRFVNVLELSTLGFGSKEKPKEFDNYFTKTKPVIFNYHGYPGDIKQLLFHHGNTERFSIKGYIEHGSTTTPFDIHVRNETSRYHLVISALEFLSKNVIKKEVAETLIKKYHIKLIEHRTYIKKEGTDLDEIEDWEWKRS